MSKEKKHEPKGWLDDLTKKQKTVFGLASLMVVILIGVFFWLGLSGKLKIGAVGEFGAAKIESMSPDSVLLCAGDDYTECTDFTASVGSLGSLNDNLHSLAVGENVYAVACQNTGLLENCIPIPAGYRNPNLTSLPTNQVDSKLGYNPAELSWQTSSVAVHDRGRLVGNTHALQSAGAGGCEPGPNQVTVYGDKNYDINNCAVLNPNDYSSPDEFSQKLTGVVHGVVTLTSVLAPVSSIKLGKNARATVFMDNDYGGGQKEITESIANLGGTGFNDEISSIKTGAKDGYITITPPTQTLPPDTKFEGTTAYSAQAVIADQDMTDYSLGTVGSDKVRRPEFYNPYNPTADDPILTPIIALTGYANNRTNITTKITGTTGAAGKYGYITLQLHDLSGAAIAQRSANLNISTTGGGNEQSVVQQYYVKSVSSGTIYDTNDNANPTLGTGVKATVIPNAEVTIHVKASNVQRVQVTNTADSTYPPKVDPYTIDAPDGKNVDADVVVSNLDRNGLINMRFGYLPIGGSTYEYFNRTIPITVAANLVITPATATLKTGETKRLFNVTGLANSDGRNAYSKDSTIAKVTGFWAVVGDNTKAVIDIAGVKEGTATIVVSSAGRTAEATVTVSGVVNPCDSCTASQTCVNSKCVDNPIIDTFTANPPTINSGDESTLTWSTTGATDCKIDNDINGVAVDGSTKVKPPYTTTYTLTCGNGGGQSVTETATVTVNGSTVCPAGKSALNAKKSLWLLKTLFTNASTSSDTLAKYLGDLTLSYFFDGFGKNYGEGKNGKASRFIGEGFWLKNKTGNDYLCLATSGSAKTSVETLLPHKGLAIIGNPLEKEIKIRDNIAFKFSSTGDKWVGWNEAFDQGLLKAAFLWDNPVNNYLSYTNLLRYGDLTKYGYQTSAKMQEKLGPNEALWIAPRSTDTVTVKISQ